MQPGGEVRGFADDRLFLRRALADQIADDHQTGGDPDPRLQLDGSDLEAAHRVGYAKPSADRPLGVVLMRTRKPEIHQYAVAHVLGDKAVEAPDDLGDAAMVCGDDLAQILGIELRGKRGRAHEIAEHHRQLPALGGENGCRRLGHWSDIATQSRDGIEQFAAMTDRSNSECDQIIGRQAGHNRGVDIVVAEGGRVTLETQAAQPHCDVHQAPPSSSSSALASLISGVLKPSVNQP